MCLCDVTGGDGEKFTLESEPGFIVSYCLVEFFCEITISLTDAELETE
jgi:hypothetical protein